MIASAVDPMRTRRARVAQVDRQPDPWDRSRYQARPNMRIVITRKGHVSTRNAGARASPADVPPKRPSRPGTTHHQGRGNSPLNNATKGLSNSNSLRMTRAPFRVFVWL